MRCERCGGPINSNKIIRLNGVLLCEKCARDLNVEDPFRGSVASMLNQPFSVLGELTNAIMTGGNDLDFANANTKIRCPKCGTTLRDVETNGTVGCIECYNTFNETILKDILKRQGSSDYKGRQPADPAKIDDIKIDTRISEGAARKKPAEPVSEKKTEPAPAKKEKADKTEILEKIKKADLGTVSDEDLEEAMKLAAKNEDYDLAVRLRDELKSRKGEN
ncbi:Protein-arginine kinase activator protein McsA [Ruminococcaceae bacterium KH2T8]|nr:Protein-arginine kinase activator protein McsA [Ruminococcaceae bacterium KH2T8]